MSQQITVFYIFSYNWKQTNGCYCNCEYHIMCFFFVHALSHLFKWSQKRTFSAFIVHKKLMCLSWPPSLCVTACSMSSAFPFSSHSLSLNASYIKKKKNRKITPLGKKRLWKKYRGNIKNKKNIKLQCRETDCKNKIQKEERKRERKKRKTPLLFHLLISLAITRTNWNPGEEHFLSYQWGGLPMWSPMCACHCICLPSKVFLHAPNPSELTLCVSLCVRIRRHIV